MLIAAGGPRARTRLAQKANIVTLATSPLTSRTKLAEMVTDIHTHAGARAGNVELAMNLFVIDEHLPSWAEQCIDVDVDVTFYEQLAPVVQRRTGH